MATIHAAMDKHLRETVLGRLKRGMFKAMTAADDLWPSPMQIRQFIVSSYKKSALWGSVVARLINSNLVDMDAPHDLVEPESIEDFVQLLKRKPLSRSFFFEWSDNNIGILIHRESHPGGGHVYVLTEFTDAEPNAPLGQVQIRVNTSLQLSIFAVLKPGGYVQFNRSNFKTDATALRALKLLHFAHNLDIREGVFEIEPKDFANENIDISPNPIFDPPIDSRFEDLVRMAHKNQIRLTKMVVSMSLIRSSSATFCMAAPLEIVQKFKTAVESGQRLELLVYWDGRCFVVSDDHYTYLAYRALERRMIPVVIMGDYPRSVGRPNKIGGKELMPSAAGVDLSQLQGPTHCEDQELLEYLLDQKLKGAQNDTMAPITMYQALFGLIDLLRDPRTREQHLHSFIKKHPIVLDPAAARVTSEVRLGKDYRVDLVIEYTLDEKRLVLVELERPDLPLFTEGRQQRAHVTHAMQQVDDWIRWWRENPTQIPANLDRTAPIHGMVVIGRNIDLDDISKRALLSANANRLIKVVTYDDLLERLERTVQNIEAGVARANLM